MRRIALCLIICLGSTGAFAQDQASSIENGLHVSIIGGCHDCHTVGYGESNGQIDPKTALMGNPVGYRGPWGTTYAANLRLSASKMSEDEWVNYLKTFQARPPMPWYNVHQLSEIDMRSLYQYIRSLGAPGAPAPEYVAPDGEPKTPYVVFAPPVMPKS